MLKKFSLRNYKNFKDEIFIDFSDIAGYQFSSDCVTNGIVSKMLIYGRNATGKTNFGKAIMNIGTTMFNELRFSNYGFSVNANSSDDAAVFSYTFQFGKHEMLYRYARVSESELREEELRIDNERIFKCDFLNQQYDFDNLKLVEAETAVIDRYMQAMTDAEMSDEVKASKLPFLRWLISNVALKNDSLLIALANYVRRMNMITVGSVVSPFRSPRMNVGFYESLDDPQKLKDFEDYLNAMGVECKLALKPLPDGEKQLYFVYDKLVPFYENASSGTLALVDLYRRVLSKAWDTSLLFLDEYDAFYHYEMAENIIKFFKRRYPNCQLIMTSHNTNLMTNKIMRPDCMFILSRSGQLTPLCKATKRELREGHNLEKMYISGEFEKYE